MSQNRPETGAMLFKGTVPGVFIRGDNALYFAHLLRELVHTHLPPITGALLQSLTELLESCKVCSGNPIQRMKEFTECRDLHKEIKKPDEPTT